MAVLGRQCGKTDYKLWQVINQRNDTFQCVLGKKQMFQRRDPLSRCYNGYNYRRLNTSYPCLCQLEDYMCDYGFKEYELTWWYSICIHDSNFEDYSKREPSWCRPGLLYNISSGYRKVPGDACVGGIEESKKPITKACNITDATNFLFYAKRKSIYRMELDEDGNSKRQIEVQLNGLRNVIALEVDYANRILFYADITKDIIMKLDMRSGNITELMQFNESRMYVEALAYDWLAENLYFCDAGSAEIGMVNVSGRHKKILLGPNQLGRPRALAVHPMKGIMLWTDWGDKPQITRANMDGTKVVSIVQKHIVKPNGLTIDYDTEKVYWADAQMDRIEYCDFNGNQRKILLSDGIPHPYAMTVYRRSVFWDDTVKQAILKVDKTSGNNKHTVLRWTYQLRDLKAFWPGRQKPGSNKCSSRPCKFICLPIAESPGFVCTCPQNLIATNTTAQCVCPGGERYVNGECKPGSGKTCTAEQYKCNDGDCIAKSWHCDGEKDCHDGSDETSCGSTTCKSNEFQCTGGRCILAVWKCDGENDCADGADEKHCSGSRTCSQGFFRCPNGRCIRNAWRCDGDNDCGDRSDEKNCSTVTTRSPPTTPHALVCTASQFKCLNWRCIDKKMHCNGINDCGDYSDEVSCDVCQGKTMACTLGKRCVLLTRKCDFHYDCPDGSDEIGCVKSTLRPPATLVPLPLHCGAGQAYCHDHSGCYDKKAMCDGMEDCYDGSDELNCDKKKCAEFQCQSGRCIPRSMKCDGKKDCEGGDDEMKCKGGRKLNCLPQPFGFNCSIPDGNCYHHSVVCDKVANCEDASDEDTKVCGTAERVRELKVSMITGTSVKLDWKMPHNTTIEVFRGYIVAQLHQKKKKVVIHGSKGFQPTYIVTHLEKCESYYFAVALNNSQLAKGKNLYQSTELVVTGGEKKPMVLSGVHIVDNELLTWTEDDITTNKCFKRYQMMERILLCGDNKKYGLSGTSVLNLKNIFPANTTQHKCKIRVTYAHDGGKPLVRQSKYFTYPVVGGPQKHKQTGRSNSKTLVWVIPVALVLAACLLGLALMVYKYRRLQHSFLAFAARSSYTRQENDFDDDDDDNMVVGFRSGEDAPMINRFSDDDPLVVG